MKFSKLLVLLAALMPVTLFAQDYYVGGGIGVTKFEDSIPGVAREINDPEFGVRIFGGYNFTPNWSMELGYADYGSSTGVYQGADLKLSAEALYMNGYYHWLFLDSWSADFMLGAQRAKGKSTLKFPSDLGFDPCASFAGFCSNQDTVWGLNAGVGLTWNITERVGVKTMLEIASTTFQDNTSINGETEDQFKTPYRFYVDAFWRF